VRQGVDVRLWLDVRSHRWVHRSLCCPAATGYPRLCDGVIQASLTIVAMLSPVGNHASRLQWIITAVLSIPAALVGGVVYKGRKPNDGLEKAPASA
jgi:hypothetical protein